MSALRLFRVVNAAVQITNADAKYDYVSEVPTFFIWGADSRDAEQRAVRVMTASASPRDTYRTRGTLVEVSQRDALGEPLDVETSRMWDDIGC